jgi:carboxyl-terminal processing protease
VTHVLGVIPGSPAARAGLTAGDKILKLDGKSFKGLQLRDVVYSIRGPAGQPIVITALRDDQILVKTVKREALVFSSVADLTLPNQVALVHVRMFNEKTPSLLKATLKRIVGQHPRGLVLDLRNNEGGMFEKVVECASAFLPRGKLVVTAINRGKKEEAYRTQDDPIVVGTPVAVLINNRTASGAEILAGALKAGIGARLIGQKTFGKWNVQRIVELPNKWAYKYTIGVFKAPWGELPDGKGIEPDLEIDMDESAIDRAQHLRESQRLTADPQLRAAVQVLKLER